MSFALIIAAPINSGKTSFLRKARVSLGKKGLALAGFTASKKILPGKKIYSLELFGEKKKRLLLEVADGAIKVNKLVFSAVRKEILEKSKDCDFVFIDEAGPLELDGKGHALLIKKLLKRKNTRLLLAVREELSEKIVSKFKPERFFVLKELALSKLFSALDL